MIHTCRCRHCGRGEVAGNGGYDAFYTDKEDRPVELQRDDVAKAFANDDEAAVAFVRALEVGCPWAVRCAREILGDPDA